MSSWNDKSNLPPAGQELQFWEPGWIDENGKSIDHHDGTVCNSDRSNGKATVDDSSEEIDGACNSDRSNGKATVDDSKEEIDGSPYIGVIEAEWPDDETASMSWLLRNGDYSDPSESDIDAVDFLKNLTKESKKRRTVLKKDTQANKTRQRHRIPSWESKLAHDIATSINPITKLNVSDVYLAHRGGGGEGSGGGGEWNGAGGEGGGGPPDDNKALECARKWCERFMRRNNFVVRRAAYTSKKSARKLWAGVLGNWNTFDRIREQIEKNYRRMGRGKSLYVVILNSDETFLRDNLQTSSVIIPKGSYASRRSQANQRDTYQGQTLLAHLSSDSRFIVDPTLIMNKNRPALSIKEDIAVACKGVFGRSLIFKNGNNKGIAWNTQELWQLECKKVKDIWAQFRDALEMQGQMAYLIWYSLSFWFESM